MSTDQPVVVTFFESYGAGAGYVAPRVAKALGVPFADQAFSSTAIEEAQQAAAAAYENDSVLGRLLARIGHNVALDVDPSVPLFQADDEQRVAENTAFVLRAGREGAVLLGRNAALLLADVPGAVHVRLDGVLEDRVARAAADAGIDLEAARRRQAVEDRVRVELSQRYYAFDPREDTAYDLVLNTSRVPLDLVADLVVATARAKRGEAPLGGAR